MYKKNLLACKIQMCRNHGIGTLEKWKGGHDENMNLGVINRKEGSGGGGGGRGLCQALCGSL